MAWKDMNFKLKASFLSALFVAIIIFCVLIIVSETLKEFSISIMIGVAAGTIGWAVGISISPYTTGEKTDFKKYAKVIGTFGTGYFLAKAGPFVQHIMKPNIVLDPVVGIRVLLSVSLFVLVVIVVYVFRQYS